jgi:aquaporin Z
MVEALRRHWPEYLIEAAGLGVFMISACLFATLLEHPGSLVRQRLPDPLFRRALMGLAMGATAVAVIYSRWGKRSGAHINPAVTLTFFRLGKVRPWDAVFYMGAQFTGAVLGVMLAAVLLRESLAEPGVGYVVTRPGSAGPLVAFGAELLISFVLMLVILIVSNGPDRVARWTGLLAGTLVALYITVEAPLSGMSLNPARSIGSALPAGVFSDLWIYFTAPPLGMLLAAQVYLLRAGARRVHCAKLHHQNDERCIFCGCGMPKEWAETAPARETSHWVE